MAKTQAETPRTRTSVTLPTTVASDGDVAWPGSNRGGGGKNATLKAQIVTDLATMGHGSVRRYDIAGSREQDAFLSLFRKACDQVHGPVFGVQGSKQNGAIFVKIGDRRAS